MELHEHSCTDKQQVNSKMKSYGCKNDEITQLTQIFNLDFNDYPQEHLVVFDIETFKRDGILVPVSIAVSSTLAGSMYFERSSDDPDAGFEMVSQFLNYIQYLHRELHEQLPDEINQAIEHLYFHKEDPKQFVQCDDNDYVAKKRASDLAKYVGNYRTLKIFGFNSRKVLQIRI